MIATPITFVVPAVPVAQPRQQQRVIKTKDGRVFATNFTPRGAPVQDFKASVRMAAQEAYQGPPLEGPLSMSMVFVMPRPGRLRWKKRPMPRCWHSQAPDADNLMKSTLDALKSLLFVDDASICMASAKKVFASGDEQPHVEVRISTLGAYDMDALDGIDHSDPRLCHDQEVA